jgi:hypothetical protein
MRSSAAPSDENWLRYSQIFLFQGGVRRVLGRVSFFPLQFFSQFFYLWMADMYMSCLQKKHFEKVTADNYEQ